MLQAALFKMIYTGIMFLAGLVLSNIAMPERFGDISLLILSASLLSLVTGLGSDSMVMHKLANNKWTVAQAINFSWNSLALQVLIFVLLELVFFLAWDKNLFSFQDSGFIIIDSIYFIGLILMEKYVALLYSMHMARKANFILIIISVIYLAVLFAFYYLTAVSFETVLYVFAFQSLITGILLVFVFHSRFRNLFKWYKENLKFTAALRLSTVIMITNVIQLFAYRIDFWLLKGFHDSYEVGLYSQASKFANLIWIVPNILAQLLIPRFSEMNKQQVGSVFRAGFYFNILLVLLAIAGTQLIYLFFLAEEYKEGLYAFYLMLPGYFFWASVSYFAAWYSWAGRFKYNLYCSIACFSLILICDLFLIPTLKAGGAAIANSIAYTSVFALYIYLLMRKSAFSFNELLLPGKMDFSKVIKLLSR